jgi:CheY-like chemotaxis protein
MTPQPQIIIVDDDHEDQLIMLEYLKESGHDANVQFMQNGRQLINYLEQLPEGASLPPLIVMDLNMPIVNGTQTLMNIKRNQRFRDVPVIILSTSENENEKRKCLSLGAVEYLVKPSTYDEGSRLVEKFTAYIQKD